MTRRVLVVFLYFLLLGLQHEGYRHGFDHLRAQLAQAHERALQLPAGPCDECALLAGAAHAATGAVAALAATPQAHVVPTARPRAHIPLLVRAYAARAPPLFV
jgi:hypothetical protein